MQCSKCKIWVVRSASGKVLPGIDGAILPMQPSVDMLMMNCNNTDDFMSNMEAKSPVAYAQAKNSCSFDDDDSFGQENYNCEKK